MLTTRRPSIAQRSVYLPTRTLRRALGWIESIANPLTCVVQAAAGAFGWPFLMASAQAKGYHSQDRQQNSHCRFALRCPTRPNTDIWDRFPKPRVRANAGGNMTATTVRPSTTRRYHGLSTANRSGLLARHRATGQAAFSTSREYVARGLSIIIFLTNSRDNPSGSTASPSNCQCG